MLTRKLVLLIAVLLFAGTLQAAQQTIYVGTSADKKSLDTNFGNAQANFVELYGWVNQGVKTTSTPVFVGTDLGVASTTTGLLRFFGNSKAYSFGIFSLGADTPSVGWRLPSTMPGGTYLISADVNGYLDYVDPATLGSSLTSLPTADNQIIQATGVGTYGWTSSVAGLIDDAAGNGDVDKLLSADRVVDLIAASGGSFTPDTFPAYEDSAHTSGIAWNSTTLAVYDTATAKWLTVALTDSLDPTPSSYIVDEEFETGSIPSGWSAGNTVTWNYATSPAPLFGSYSVYPADSTSYAIASFTAANEIYVTFAMQQSGADINLEVLRLYNGTTSLGNTLIGSDGSLRSIATGGTSSNGGAADLAYVTTTYIKTRFITNGTSNTTVTTWSSLDGYTWVLESSCTNGTGTLPVDVIKLRGGSGSSRVFDRVKISTTDIDDAR